MIESMRYLLVMLLLLMPLSAPAQQAQDRAARLDRLHTDLLAAETPGEAREITNRIWLLWFQAPDAKAQALLDFAQDRSRARDYDAAIDALDDLTSRYPGYAEGWNQRATLFYLQGKFGPSLADVSKVLELEPRHFGALAGKALILFRQDRRDAANRALLDALRVHPWLPERRLLDPAYSEQPL